jgi:hypothetical protein
MTRRNQPINRFLLPVVAFGALCVPGRSQTSGDPSKLDIAGIRLGISVEQARAALQAHDPSMKVQMLQSPSQIGKGQFVSAVVGATGSQKSYYIGSPGKSDAIFIAFTETEGNKAYSITRVSSFDRSSPALESVLIQQLIEKHGKPHFKFCPYGQGQVDCGPYDHRVPRGLSLSTPAGTSAYAMLWNFGPDGQPVDAERCTAAYGAPTAQGISFTDIGQVFFFPAASHLLPEDRCGTGLTVTLSELNTPHPSSSDSFVIGIQELLVDAQLENRNLTNIRTVQKDTEAKRLPQELKDEGKGSEFVGIWVNTKNPSDKLEITRNGDQFLIGKAGATYKDDGTLQAPITMGFTPGTVTVTYIKSSGMLALVATGVPGQMEFKRLLPSERGTSSPVSAGAGMSGKYVGPNLTIEFKSDNTAFVTVSNLGVTFGTTEGKYEVDGDKIILHANDRNLVLTRNNDGTLSGGPFNQTLTKVN